MLKFRKSQEDPGLRHSFAFSNSDFKQLVPLFQKCFFLEFIKILLLTFLCSKL